MSSRTCQSLAASSRASAARLAGPAGFSPSAWLTGAALSITVHAIARPRPVSSSSMILACSGQSMCDAVVTCQNPPGYPSSRIAVTACTWVCPFTQATTHGWASSRSRSSAASTRRLAPGGRRSFTSVSSG